MIPQIRFHTYEDGKLIKGSWVDSYESGTSTFIINVNGSYSPRDAAFDPTMEFTMESQPIRVGEITFKTTSIEYDVSQTIIPFLDGCDSVADPAVPLHSFGLHYKSFKMRPGFIGFQVGTYNFQNWLQQLNEKSKP